MACVCVQNPTILQNTTNDFIQKVNHLCHIQVCTMEPFVSLFISYFMFSSNHSSLCFFSYFVSHFHKMHLLISYHRCWISSTAVKGILPHDNIIQWSVQRSATIINDVPDFWIRDGTVGHVWSLMLFVLNWATPCVPHTLFHILFISFLLSIEITKQKYKHLWGSGQLPHPEIYRRDLYYDFHIAFWCIWTEKTRKVLLG